MDRRYFSAQPMRELLQPEAAATQPEPASAAAQAGIAPHRTDGHPRVSRPWVSSVPAQGMPMMSTIPAVSAANAEVPAVATALVLPGTDTCLRSRGALATDASTT